MLLSGGSPIEITHFAPFGPRFGAAVYVAGIDGIERPLADDEFRLRYDRKRLRTACQYKVTKLPGANWEDFAAVS